MQIASYYTTQAVKLSQKFSILFQAVYDHGWPLHLV